MFLQNWNGGEIHKNMNRKYQFINGRKESRLYDNVSDLVAGEIPEVTYGLSKQRLNPIAKKSKKTRLENLSEVKIDNIKDEKLSDLPHQEQKDFLDVI